MAAYNPRMDTPLATERLSLKRLGGAVRDVVLETLWPTRCAVCDAPGERVICDECKRELSFVDSCLACPVCGAPYGRVQCTQCNDVVLASLGLDALPVDGMAHATVLDEASRRIVTVYKDADERRLASEIAGMLARYVSPDRVREGCVVSYIPDTAAAVRRRGFDHAREIAEATAERAGMRCARLFLRPKTRDQRKLGKRERIANMTEKMTVAPEAEIPASVLLIDDVCTTGATMFGAAAALRRAGAEHVWALTFALAVG